MSMEKQWPVKILLVHPRAPFMQKDSLIVAADCALLVNPELASRFKNGETVIVGCPILEDPDRLAEKLSLVAEETGAKKIEVYTMEVPCCHPIHTMVCEGVENSKKDKIELKQYIVRVMTGKAEPYTPGKLDVSMMEMERKVHGGAHAHGKH